MRQGRPINITGTGVIAEDVHLSFYLVQEPFQVALQTCTTERDTMSGWNEVGGLTDECRKSNFPVTVAVSVFDDAPESKENTIPVLYMFDEIVKIRPDEMLYNPPITSKPLAYVDGFFPECGMLMVSYLPSALPLGSASESSI